MRGGKTKLDLKKYNNILFIPCILGMVVFLCIFAMTSSVHSQMKDRFFADLRFSAQEQQRVFEIALRGQTSVLNAIADGAAAELNAGRTPHEVLARLSLSSYPFDFTHVGVVLPNGSGELNNGKTMNIADRGYFQKAKKGVTSLTKIESGVIGGEPRFIISVPVRYDGKNVGVVFGSFSNKKFKEIIQLERVPKDTYSLILDSDGRIIFDSSDQKSLISKSNAIGRELGANVFTLLKQSRITEGGGAAQVKKNVEEGRIGTIGYKFRGNARYAVYAPLHKNGWILFSVVSEFTVKRAVGQMTGLITLMVLVIGICSVSLLIYIFQLNQKKNRELLAEHEKLRQSDELYRIVENFSDTVLFEINMATEDIIYNHNFVEKFGYVPRIKNLRDFGEAARLFVNPDDVKMLLGKLSAVRRHDFTGSFDFRLRTPSDGEQWMRIELARLTDSSNQTRRIVGRLTNIDEEKRSITALQTQAESDSMTGLLNHTAVEAHIADALRSGEKGALLIIDIDHFKEVNDCLGHLEGDRVLIVLSSLIKQHFRDSDITGRIGGDEFIVFTRGAHDRASLKKIGERLCKNVEGAFSSGERSLTISVGAVLTRRGADFAGLYKEADAALYAAKEAGRNACRVYSAKH